MYQGSAIDENSITDLLKKNPSVFGGKGKDAELKKADREKLFYKLPQDILDISLNAAKESFEKFYLEYQLSKHHGILSKTAEAIGIYPSNLHAKLRKYQISVPNSNIKEE
jgi:two-component system nitrogen regulation response regulator NtrX